MSPNIDSVSILCLQRAGQNTDQTLVTLILNQSSSTPGVSQEDIKMSIYSALIHQALMSYMAGRLLTIFFKRRFSFKVHTRKDVLDVLPVFMASFLTHFASLGPALGAAALLYSNSRHIHDEMVKTMALWLSFHVAVYADWDENTFACLALAFATTQFLRKPDKLKEGKKGWVDTKRTPVMPDNQG